VDDALLRLDDQPRGGPVRKDGYYQLTDSSFSVAAHLDLWSGALRQRVSYDAYGTPRVILPGDFDGDGSVKQGDLAAFTAAHDANLPSADVDGDGMVGSGDKGYFYDHWAAAGVPEQVEGGFSNQGQPAAYFWRKQLKSATLSTGIWVDWSQFA
jgi:hypothetical protein